MQTFHLTVLTPYGKYFDGDVEFIEVRSEKYSLGIYHDHAPLISTVDISKMVIRTSVDENTYAVGGGVIKVDNNQVNVILNSIERSDEIDIERAKQAKERAEKRLKENSVEHAVDINRAKASLLRALNRLDIGSKD